MLEVVAAVDEVGGGPSVGININKISGGSKAYLSGICDRLTYEGVCGNMGDMILFSWSGLGVNQEYYSYPSTIIRLVLPR